MVQGARDVGAAILDNPQLDGLLFTGSAKTGAFIHKYFGGRPEIVLALEMGGNNPLIIWDVKDVKAAVSLAVQSGFITSGQRCTCARRLIIPKGAAGDAIVQELMAQIKALKIGPWDSAAANIGPLISGDIASSVGTAAIKLVAKGATPLISSEIDIAQGDAFLKPGLYDVTGCDVADEEIFGPLLQLIRVEDWEAAIAQANNTRFGLAAGLVSDDVSLWEDFSRQIRAGVVNFNRPTTGAAGFLPFGGPGLSGNHNPGAYYAADFCAWPMASQVADAPRYSPLEGPK
jgi:succinylglutamic semialdehyde dehydrogenase